MFDMRFQLTNIKISIKVLKICLNNVEQILKRQKKQCKKYSNYIVIQDRFTYIVFKPSIKKNLETSHVNITKIPNIDMINKAIYHLIKIINCTYVSNSKTIDNITASVKIPKDLTPEKIVNIFRNRCRITFNKETFPGVFLKFETGTAIVFHTGKCIVIGCKKIVDLEETVEKILTNLKNE